MLSTSQLDEVLTGRVITPGDPGYDKARTIAPGGYDRRPAVIAQVADAADVSRVLGVARESGLPLAVKSGGHSPAAHGLVDDGIVVDVSQMKGLTFDLEGTAWAETGLTAGEYTAAAGAHGVATGFGFLVRKYGMTIDQLLAAEVVTADGEVRHVDEETDPDLFWALRGGGGNFGVATRFKFRLQPVDEILGGILVLPAEPSVIASFVAEAEAAPDELSTIANVMTAPPLPFNWFEMLPGLIGEAVELRRAQAHAAAPQSAQPAKPSTAPAPA